MKNIKMLYYDRIDISEAIDVNKTSESKERDTTCNGRHDLLMMSMNLSDIAIFNIKGADYCCIVNGISKSETINLMKIMDLIF